MVTRNATQTLRSARSGSSAPRFCPTSAAAAEANPQAGSIVKISRRIETVYPATAASPKLATIRIRKTQLAEATRY